MWKLFFEILWNFSYRANLWALKQLGANVILATTAVGSLSADFPRGTLVVFGK
jgi:5'-methylthioadenosine phosphorylase